MSPHTYSLVVRVGGAGADARCHQLLAAQRIRCRVGALRVLPVLKHVTIVRLVAKGKAPAQQDETTLYRMNTL